MKKYQDEFSSSSYEELLKKYGAENAQRNASRQAQGPATQQGANRPSSVNNAQQPAASRSNTKNKSFFSKARAGYGTYKVFPY